MTEFEFEYTRLMGELEEISTDIRSFLRALAHDLREPLSGMDQLLSWIVADIYEDVDLQTQHHLDLLQDRMKRMSERLTIVLRHPVIAKLQLVALKEQLKVMNSK